MTREEAAKYAELLQAYADGKTLEFKPEDGKQWYICSPTSCRDFKNGEWRIKPEPREFWVNIYPDKSMTVHRYEGASASAKYSAVAERFKVREVID